MSKRYIAPFEDDRVRLRLLQASDLPTTLRWRNQDHIRKWFFHADVITPEQHRSWFQKYSECDDDYIFVIEGKAEFGFPVGQASIYHIDWCARRAEFGRLMIGEANVAGKGLAHAATRLLVDYAFGPLDLNELYLEVFDANTAAVAIYTACGFEVAAKRGNVMVMSKVCLRVGR